MKNPTPFSTYTIVFLLFNIFFIPGATSQVGVLSCSSSLTNQSNGTIDNLNSYPCRNADFSGPDTFYILSFDEDVYVNISMTNKSDNIDMMILTDNEDANTCIAWGITDVAFNPEQGNNYFLVVDGFMGASGTFDLEMQCIPITEITDQVLDINCTNQISNQSNENGSQILNYYPCRPGVTFKSNEVIYKFSVAVQQQVTIDLSYREDPFVDIFLMLDPTDPSSCIGWSDGDVPPIQQTLDPGDYYLVVDGSGVTTYTVDFTIDCTGVQNIVNCSSLLLNQTNGTTDDLNNYVCRNFNFSGPDTSYVLTLDEDVFVNIRYLNKSGPSDMFILLEEDDPSTCINWSSQEMGFYGQKDIPYYLVVDGLEGGNARFDLEFNCTDLSVIQESIIDISCQNMITGETNSGGLDLFTVYPCRQGSFFTGPEKIYEFTVGHTQTVEINQVNNTAFTDFFLLTDPLDPLSCIGWTNGVEPPISATLDQGTYYLVVDGFNENEGTYDIVIDVDCNPIPTISEWGIMILMLIMLILSHIYISEVKGKTIQEA